MLDEKDLQAIQDMISVAEQRIAKSTVTLMDAEFKSRFNLLADGIQVFAQSRIADFGLVDNLERPVDKRQRRTYLMSHLGEEVHLPLVQFLS